MTTTNTEALEKTISKLMLQLNTINQVAGYLADALFGQLDCNATELGLDINEYRKQLSPGCESGFGMQVLDVYKKYVETAPCAKPAVYVFDSDNWQSPNAKDAGGGT
ncbi:hypothetical protein H0A36_28825 [Endozoicomonas sp. SM1973]|uniref:Uncharacterized protein n=1 Tax=Spartinivicinus marinus TaxID=2994442 RepID=A0A853I9Q9_9GAMM|nr:hypothetical protein [Spartinivicinus marinus]MCX4026973.1 hypothetical protein [Spartinivicinus marinus]NYZ70023.1 hypothetical protein [Spartinivicinus marinus]